MTGIVERLRERANDKFIRDHPLMAEAADEIERLRSHNAALVETVKASLCPYNGRTTGVTVGECQQCGCTSGLMIERGGMAKVGWRSDEPARDWSYIKFRERLDTQDSCITFLLNELRALQKRMSAVEVVSLLGTGRNTMDPNDPNKPQDPNKPPPPR